MKLKLRKMIFAFMAILWMGIIFYCSDKPAVESAQMSGSVDRIICRIFIRSYDEMTPAQQEEAAMKLDHLVRKCAHATEYMILGVLITGTFYSGKSEKVIRLFLYWGGVILYAVSDEIHQLFVEGRAGRVTDVLIDSSGGLIGCLLFTCLYAMINEKTNDNRKKYRKKYRKKKVK